MSFTFLTYQTLSFPQTSVFTHKRSTETAELWVRTRRWERLNEDRLHVPTAWRAKYSQLSPTDHIVRVEMSHQASAALSGPINWPDPWVVGAALWRSLVRVQLVNDYTWDYCVFCFYDTNGLLKVRLRVRPWHLNSFMGVTNSFLKVIFGGSHNVKKKEKLKKKTRQGHLSLLG